MENQRNRDKLTNFTPVSSDTGQNNGQVLQDKLVALELTNRSLNEQLLLKKLEINRLEAQIEELRFLYNQSLNSRRYYDQYLDTVGEVYAVACECADSIVNRAENKAKEILSRVEEKAREELDKPLQETEKIRARLTGTISELIENLQNTYNEINLFCSEVETAPQSIEHILDSQQLISEIREDVEQYQKRSRAILAQAKQSKNSLPEIAENLQQENICRVTDTIPDTMIQSEPKKQAQPDYKPTEKVEETTNRNGTKRRMTLLEQEKLRRKQEIQAQEQKENKKSVAPVKEEVEDSAGENGSKDHDNRHQNPRSLNKNRRTNVKDLLEKYKNYQLA